jgi:ribosomal protein L11 methyltransferase
MEWVELAVDVDREAVEATSELFAQYGYNQGVVVEETIIPQPDEDYVVDLTAPVQVRTYIVADEQAEDIRQRIAEALWHLGRLRHVSELRATRLKEEDWANAWKAYYQTQRIGKHMIIKPSWLEYTAQPGDYIIDLAPAIARALMPGGLAITSGIIDERGADVDAALRKAGITILDTRQEGDWLAIIVRRDEC